MTWMTLTTATLWENGIDVIIDWVMGVRSLGLRSLGLRSLGLRSLGLRSCDLRSPHLRSPGLRSPGLRSLGLRCRGFRSLCLHSPSLGVSLYMHLPWFDSASAYMNSYQSPALTNPHVLDVMRRIILSAMKSRDS